ncbi:MAG: glycerol-3-phosphate 1-O-acyltransferase PlsY [Acidimicrobiia bacterium]
MASNLVLVLAAYLIGTFPTAILVGRQTGHDPTSEGSGNPGASNVYRTAGRRAGAMVAIGDIAKGALPALAGWLIGGRAVGFACWVAAVVGHILPATRRFRGGKGVATAGGGVLVLLPLVAACCLAAFVLAIKRFKTASIGSIVMFVLGPVLTAAFGRPGWEVAVVAAVSVIVLARHAGNIKRLATGDELGLGDDGPAP